MSRKGKSVKKVEQWLPQARGEEEGAAANGYKESFWGDENILKLACGGCCTIF